MRPAGSLAAAFCLFLGSCGGGGSSDAPPQSAMPSPIAQIPSPTARTSAPVSADEINEGNALLVASIADLSLARYVDYRQSLERISGYALAYSPPVPESTPCGGTSADGRLKVQTVSTGSFIVTPESCKLYSGEVMKSGTVKIENYARTPGGFAVVFDATFMFLQLGADNPVVIAGTATYDYSSSHSASASAYTYRNSANLDFTKDGKTDQYRNWKITFSQTSTSGMSEQVVLNVESLEISTPRAEVASILASTPTPLTISSSGSISGSVAATSAKDGSRVQYDYIDTDTVRLRNWDSKGNLLLDSIKKQDDPDVVAAEAAAGG